MEVKPFCVANNNGVAPSYERTYRKKMCWAGSYALLTVTSSFDAHARPWPCSRQRVHEREGD